MRTKTERIESLEQTTCYNKNQNRKTRAIEMTSASKQPGSSGNASSFQQAFIRKRRNQWLISIGLALVVFGIAVERFAGIESGADPGQTVQLQSQNSVVETQPRGTQFREQSAVSNVSFADSTSTRLGSRYTSIEQIRVGMRVAANNPEVSDAERAKFVDPDPATWRHLTLRMPKLNGSFMDIEMLRPVTWLKERNAEEGSGIYLDMPEVGAVGYALIKKLRECPEIQPGDGEVVISTFAHPPSHKLLDLTIADEVGGPGETIGVTATHPFWSEDRQAFVPAGTLNAGDRVRTHSGETKVVASNLPRPGPVERVYNLEVNGEHVFYVGGSSTLVHNMGCSLAVGDIHPQTGHKILAELEHGDRLDFMIEAAKPSRRGKLVRKHYLENPGHHDPFGGLEDYVYQKSVVPANQVELFESSIVYKGTRYSMDDTGIIHQFQDSLNGAYHWAGSQAGKTHSGQLVPLVVPAKVVSILKGLR